jgi:DNA-directed RNA polymerase subunit M/transcription elongation factor TFIIS
MEVLSLTDEKKCPKCGESLEKKASIKDYSYMFFFECKKCGYKITEKPVST